MLKISKEANPNYLAEVVRIKTLKEVEGAKTLQIAIVNFSEVAVSKDVKVGDVMVFFPVECTINKDYLSKTNSFSSKGLNEDPEVKGGFFGDKGRVKAVRFMKGKIKSVGYLAPAQTFMDVYGVDVTEYVNTEFDTIAGVRLVEKYVIPKKQSNSKQNKKPKVTRIIEGQVHLHTDTEQLRRNVYKINPHDEISVTYKTHGTSGWASHVLVKRRLNWVEKLLKYLGVKIDETEFDLVYGSRKVVKNASLEDPKRKDHFFGYDLWKDVVDRYDLKNKIPKGFSIYYEILGFDKNGNYIQEDFDYGCKLNEDRIEIYRVTQTNAEGVVTELTHKQMLEFCERAELPPVHTLHVGKAYWVVPDLDVNAPEWGEQFIKNLEDDYLEKDCFMCMNEVPAEGVVVRKESLIGFEAFKLKAFRFLEYESKQLDKGEPDIESQN